MKYALDKVHKRLASLGVYLTEFLVNVCPGCGAKAKDYDSFCEYCGTKLKVSEAFETAIKNTEIVLKDSSRILSESYKIQKSDLDIIDRLNSSYNSLNPDYSESKLVLEKNKLIKNQINLLEQKISSFKKAQCTKAIVRSVLFSIFAEILIFILIVLVSVFDREKLKTVIVGILGLIGLLVGLGVSVNSSYVWGGVLLGLLAGSSVGFGLFYLIVNPICQLILLICGFIGMILGIIFGIKKAKKNWK